MSMAIVTLKKGEGRTLKAGGAWIYDNEIESIMGNAENGEIVLVHDFDGYPLGRGFINRNSKIRVRMMTRHIDQEIDPGISENACEKCMGLSKDNGRYILVPGHFRRSGFPSGSGRR